MIDYCSNSPCKYGNCVSVNGAAKCNCVTGYTGPYCDIQIDYCVSLPCLNGGSCISLLNKYLCSCPVGYTGQNCNIMINPCSNTVCLNNGLCVPNQGSYGFS